MIGGGARMILQRGFAENGITLPDDMLDAATEDPVLGRMHILMTARGFSTICCRFCKSAQCVAGISMAVVTNKREGLSAKLLFWLACTVF